MKRTSTWYFGALAGAIALAGIAGAALIFTGVGDIGFPQLTYGAPPNPAGELTYNSGTQELSINATPLRLRLTPMTPPPGRIINAVGGQRVLEIRIFVNSSGQLVSGVPGNDLQVIGRVDTDGDMIDDFSGVLLTGEVIDFGWRNNAEGTTDEYDFRFFITGGAMDSQFPSKDVAIIVSSENSTFDGNFSVDFAGGAKGTLGSNPAVCDLDLMVQACVTPQPPSSGSIRPLTVKLTTNALGLGTTAMNDGSTVKPDVAGKLITSPTVGQGSVLYVQRSGLAGPGTSLDPLLVTITARSHLDTLTFPAGFPNPNDYRAGVIYLSSESTSTPDGSNEGLGVKAFTVNTGTGPTAGMRQFSGGLAKIEGSKEVSGGTGPAAYSTGSPNGAPHVDEDAIFTFAPLSNVNAKSVVVRMSKFESTDRIDVVVNLEGGGQKSYPFSGPGAGNSTAFVGLGNNTWDLNFSMLPGLSDTDVVTSFIVRAVDADPAHPSGTAEHFLISGFAIAQASPPECLTTITPTGNTNNCQGKVVSMKMVYTGESCSATRHTQDPTKVSCTGDPMSATPVRIRVSDKSSPTDGTAKVYFDGLVEIDDMFTASASNATPPQSVIANDTYVHIMSTSNAVLQTIKFHTSCSQPLNVGDQFGSVKLVSLTATEGGTSNLGGSVTYTYKVTNNSNQPLFDVQVSDDVFGPVPGSPIMVLVPGQMMTLTRTVTLFETTTVTVTASGRYLPTNGPLFQCPDEEATVTISVVPAPQSCCLNGRPRVITMQYTGQNCMASSHSQDPTKVFCSGDPIHTALVRIRASNKSSPTDSTAKVWFDGMVNLGSTYDIDAGNAGQTRLDTDTWIHVFDLNNRLMQTIRFHTSCSQPLFEGNQFGSALIVGCMGENLPVESDCCQHGKPRMLTMKYTATNCLGSHHFQAPGKVTCTGDATLPQGTVRIRASNKSNPTDPKAKVYFDGNVPLNGTFDIKAANAGQRRLRSDTWLHIFNGTRIVQTVKFHTSCSQPLNMGDQYGAAMLVSCVGENEAIPGAFCTGGLKPRVLRMRYIGSDCDSSQHSQAPGKVICSGDPMMATAVRIRATNSASPNDAGARVWFDGVVPIMGEFDIDAGNAGQTRLATNTWVYVYDLNDMLLQTVQFHTSCSQPLNANDQYGSLTLVGFQGQ